jgi:NAD(P)H-hydrate epimerase
MKVFTTSQIREIDAYTINHEPVSSIDLMERAALGCTDWLVRRIPTDRRVLIFAGPGNNGGDGWAVARMMAERGYHRIMLFLLKINRTLSPDSEVNRKRLSKQKLVPVYEISAPEDFPEIRKEDIVIDALFGSGLTRPLEGLPIMLIRHINDAGSYIVSVDIPSGLMGEENPPDHDHGIIRANDTLTFHFPKLSFFFAENYRFTGEWHIVPIGLHSGIIEQLGTDYDYMTLPEQKGMLRKRKRFSHKGNYGHALLIAGSYGMTGAAILAAKSCLRAGIGLLTTHIPGKCYPIIQGVVPESTYHIDEAADFFSNLPDLAQFSAIGIGPGLGTHTETAKALVKLIKSFTKPLVLDADALNIIAKKPGLLGLLPENSIITPHPKEFDRIAGESGSAFHRHLHQIELARKYRIIVVLKGAFTSLAFPNGKCTFNSTGNPGMATAGSGDVLTGVILSLLAQGYAPAEAAKMGVFLHGFAGDLAAEKTGYPAMIASDIIDHLSDAFKKTENYES